jgi:hypothetical protein
MGATVVLKLCSSGVTERDAKCGDKLEFDLMIG